MLRSSISRLTRTLSSKISKAEPIKLGRWNLSYTEQELEKKIRWANEDHCGTCTGSNESVSSKKTVNTNNSTQPSRSGNYKLCCGKSCPDCLIFRNICS